MFVVKSTKRGISLKGGGVIGCKFGMVVRKVGGLQVVTVWEFAGTGTNFKLQ